MHAPKGGEPVADQLGTFTVPSRVVKHLPRGGSGEGMTSALSPHIQ